MNRQNKLFLCVLLAGLFQSTSDLTARKHPFPLKKESLPWPSESTYRTGSTVFRVGGFSVFITTLFILPALRNYLSQQALLALAAGNKNSAAEYRLWVHRLQMIHSLLIVCGASSFVISNALLGKADACAESKQKLYTEKSQSEHAYTALESSAASLMCFGGALAAKFYQKKASSPRHNIGARLSEMLFSLASLHFACRAAYSGSYSFHKP